MLLSTKIHPIIHLANKLGGLFPAIESTYLIYNSENKIKAIQDSVSIDFSTEELFQLQIIRAASVNYQWVRPEDFISTNVTSTYKQLKLTDEFENRLLLLHFTSPFDQLKDTIALTFPINATFFSMQKEWSALNTDEKRMIGELVHKIFQSEYHDYYTFHSQLDALQHYYRISENKQIEKMESNPFELFFKQTVTKSLIEKSSKYRVDFNLTEKGLKLLALHCISETSEINSMIDKIVALSLIIFPQQNEILLDEKLIEAALFKKNNSLENNKEIKNTPRISVDKTILLLEKYELAAQKVQQQGLPINGKNIGAFLDPKISPPAISDAIKKNTERIKNIFIEAPTKWMSIRTFLKPLREIDLSIKINAQKRV